MKDLKDWEDLRSLGLVVGSFGSRIAALLFFTIHLYSWLLRTRLLVAIAPAGASTTARISITTITHHKRRADVGVGIS